MNVELNAHIKYAELNAQMNIVELFAGAGGLAQGFLRAGFYKVAALYDIFQPARSSYLAFDPSANYELADVHKLKKKSVFAALDGKTLHGIIGGPPCTGFSLAGKRLNDAEINALVLSYARVVGETKPQFLVMENVPQLLFHLHFAPLLRRLRRQYRVTYGILNAARYGTPQTRHRLFVIAYHKDLGVTPTLPLPTHGQEGQLLYAYNLDDPSKRVRFDAANAEMLLGADPVISRELVEQIQRLPNIITRDLKPLVTVGDAISDLADLARPDHLPVKYSIDATSDYQRTLRSATGYVANCFARRHVGKPLDIALTLREGGTPDSDGSSRNKKYYSQAYGRLHRAGLARTLTTYFQNAGSGRFLHYSQNRTLTIREAARLQGFSDDYVFCGTLEEQMQLIGNAVPVPLAEAIARHVAAELGSYASA